MLFGDAVRASAFGIDLLGLDLESELLLQGPSNGTAHRVWLPLQCSDHLADADAFGPLEHGDQLGLLAVGARRVGRRGAVGGRSLGRLNGRRTGAFALG